MFQVRARPDPALACAVAHHRSCPFHLLAPRTELEKCSHTSGAPCPCVTAQQVPTQLGSCLAQAWEHPTAPRQQHIPTECHADLILHPERQKKHCCFTGGSTGTCSCDLQSEHRGLEGEQYCPQLSSYHRKALLAGLVASAVLTNLFSCLNTSVSAERS